MSFVSNITLPDGTDYPVRASAIPYGEVDSTSTSTVFTATVPGVYSLLDGTCILLRNGQVTSASGFTININNLGAKPVYSNLATGNDLTPTAPTRDTTIFNINYTMLFVYTTTLVDGGAWICYRGYDANTNTIGYQLRTNSGNLVASDNGYKYRLWFTSADNTKWVPANTSTSTNATTARTMNTRPINPFGPIVYNSTNGTVNSGERPAVGTLWQQYTLTIGYSYVLSLTTWKPVYVQCTPQSDGSAVMNAIVKALPTSNDGKIYIYLGIAYSTTAMELRTEHPVFYHDGTGIRVWTGKTIPTKTSDLINDGDGTSAFATMADIGDLGGGTITSVKTTAGAHSTVNITSGAVNFNVPTKTSHLTNDSGFLTSYTETDPVYSASAAAGITSIDISNWNNKTSNIGTVTGVKINGTTKTPTSGIVDIGTVLTSYTETDPTVPSWAKASSKPSYTASLVGAAASSHTHGNITNAGDITSTATIANGDRLVINDLSASKVTNSSITFGTATNQYLANNGTWQTVPEGTTIPEAHSLVYTPASTDFNVNNVGDALDQHEGDIAFLADAAIYTGGTGIDITNNVVSVLSNLSVVGDTAYLQYATPSLEGCFIKKHYDFYKGTDYTTSTYISPMSLTLAINAIPGYIPFMVSDYTFNTSGGNITVQNLLVTETSSVKIFIFPTNSGTQLPSLTLDVVYINIDLILLTI